MVFVPALPRRARTPVIAAVAFLVLAIGFTRLALGVHFLSDVLGAWALGVAWLGVTAYATEVWRGEGGLRPPPPPAEGVGTEAGRDPQPTPPAGPPPPPPPPRAGAGPRPARGLVFRAPCAPRLSPR